MIIVDSINQIGSFIEDLQSCYDIYLDTESTGLDFISDKLLLIQIKLNGNIYVFDVRKLKENEISYIVGLINEKAK